MCKIPQNIPPTRAIVTVTWSIATKSPWDPTFYDLFWARGLSPFFELWISKCGKVLGHSPSTTGVDIPKVVTFVLLFCNKNTNEGILSTQINENLGSI
jgi:hypothetical protein